jgi:hypothetical protein
MYIIGSALWRKIYMKINVALILSFSLLVASCGFDSSPESLSNSRAISESEPTSGGSGSGRGSGSGTSDLAAISPEAPAKTELPLDRAENAKQAPVSSDRKIIRNAELEIEADSPDQAQQRITTIAENAGGFVVESQQRSSDVRSNQRDSVTMTIRIPSEKFSGVLDEIRAASGRIIVESIKGLDVTEEFIDVEARLAAERAHEAQLMEILKRATTINDAISVQRQLSETRSSIERIEGRKRFLENQSSLSTIKLQIRTPAAIAASGEGFFYRLTESLNSGLRVAESIVLGLISFGVAMLPFVILFGLPGYLAARYLLRRERRRKLAEEMIAEENAEG